jgi:hypothetical protein
MISRSQKDQGPLPSTSLIFGRLVLIGAVLAGGSLVSGPVRAQGKLDARYTASLAGIPLGKGAWVIDITDDQYTAAASGATTGLLRVFASGEGTGASRGHVSGGVLVPSSYAATVTADKKSEQIRMVLNGSNVKEFDVEPPTPPHPDRVPLTEAHRRGVTDPMTAALLRVPGNGDPLVPEACHRTLPIFDGRMRYNLQFSFKRMDHVKAEKGYEGAAVVCAVYFTPLAGHIPERPAIKYLTDLRDMEVWLAPVAGTRVLVPFRVSIPTPLGLGLLQATQFISTPLPRRAATSVVKTQ